jgi:hypothetical protein
MAKASISKAWDETRAILVRDARLFVAVGAALLVLPGTLAAVVNPAMLQGVAPGEVGEAILWLAVLIIGLIARLAVARLAMGATSVGQAMKEGAMRSPSTTGAFLIFLIPITLLLRPILPRLLDTPETPDGPATLGLLAILIMALVFGVRLVLLAIPIAIAEKGNPIRLMQRNWILSRGSWWRLIGLVLLYFIASAIVAQVVQVVVGSLIRLLGGTIDPWSVGALILGLAVSAAGAVFAVILSVMVTRIYLQLTGSGAAAERPSVPRTGD